MYNAEQRHREISESIHDYYASARTAPTQEEWEVVFSVHEGSMSPNFLTEKCRNYAGHYLPRIRAANYDNSTDPGFYGLGVDINWDLACKIADFRGCYFGTAAA